MQSLLKSLCKAEIPKVSLWVPWNETPVMIEIIFLQCQCLLMILHESKMVFPLLKVFSSHYSYFMFFYMLVVHTSKFYTITIPPKTYRFCIGSKRALTSSWNRSQFNGLIVDSVETWIRWESGRDHNCGFRRDSILSPTITFSGSRALPRGISRLYSFFKPELGLQGMGMFWGSEMGTKKYWEVWIVQ